MQDSRATPRFGSLLRSLRLAAGLTQEVLAERAGVAARTIQDLERGIARPRRGTVRRLVAALGRADGDIHTILASLRHLGTIAHQRGRPGDGSAYEALRSRGRVDIDTARPI